MFGFEYFLALMKIAINVAFAIVGSIPLFYAWNLIAPIYLSEYLPKIYLKLPFWHIVSLLILLHFISEQVQALFPRLVSVSHSNTNNSNNK